MLTFVSRVDRQRLHYIPFYSVLSQDRIKWTPDTHLPIIHKNVGYWTENRLGQKIDLISSPKSL